MAFPEAAVLKVRLGWKKSVLLEYYFMLVLVFLNYVLRILYFITEQETKY